VYPRLDANKMARSDNATIIKTTMSIASGNVLTKTIPIKKGRIALT